MDEKKVKVSQIEEHVNKSIKNKSVKDWTRGKGSNRSRMSDQDKLYRFHEMLGQIRSMLDEG